MPTPSTCVSYIYLLTLIINRSTERFNSAQVNRIRTGIMMYMDEEQNNQAIPKADTGSKKSLFTVTPFSKFLALALFVVLPFAGFF